MLQALLSSLWNDSFPACIRSSLKLLRKITPHVEHLLAIVHAVKCMAVDKDEPSRLEQRASKRLTARIFHINRQSAHQVQLGVMEVEVQRSWK